ncbi:hypothetical protein L596_010856 [Steinernema carpocapsae]|uniref:Uncharacterized protein n=1 Tax=Steinernema carpocapsae TaxID=34508 RepID=A0A4U5PKD5_STECR|nr:hypothetical protein L596_010856 [Steinernema carpocapsae]
MPAEQQKPIQTCFIAPSPSQSDLCLNKNWWTKPIVCATFLNFGTTDGPVKASFQDRFETKDISCPKYCFRPSMYMRFQNRKAKERKP